MSYKSSPHKHEKGAPIPDDLLPFACTEDIGKALTVAAACGTDALAAKWCKLTRFQQQWVATEFPALWTAAERADVGWRNRREGASA
jgi:hypothetical protein